LQPAPCCYLLDLFFGTINGGSTIAGMSATFPQTVRRYIANNSTLHSHRFENLKSDVSWCLIYIHHKWSRVSSRTPVSFKRSAHCLCIGLSDLFDHRQEAKTLCAILFSLSTWTQKCHQKNPSDSRHILLKSSFSDTVPFSVTYEKVLMNRQKV
jgi:hypothetical protein